ncbi:SDR family NAD(P)-dependent oxidoreductase [Halomonas sp. McH1-25]|uniref:SDR family NAD(P)-dependent oxidoreductase n=1 Tax=unclassified Halomonas TaxID=2609666 RepID=UPI001EF4C290|nr:MULTISPECIES: SDR family NAD(P)-dependent oxidoreductase [unclassified Halomonas]MCG7602166.1 SDR family NAD(P)-dependent oxidoreductase [Halomonas sp. McH1-25]MCP1344505.1 SDR family NAD(P)-dependent oxidoreductase [Halomonas sp. FL8]MCP1360776.1 SDR family NAD(P)-dependent oxidoreductase [Halomonas sp. BBD45]MCP1365456.1 SDR family NAD(P)-dependent oxidoreductase [Halomonas sp. BBD48]
MQLAHHTFLVTGAASGLGAATAERLAAGGANVVLTDLSETVEHQARRLGSAAVAVRGDVVSPDDMQAAVDCAVAMGGLHGVVHCAGVVSVAKLLDREGNPADLEAFRRTVDINLVGTFNVLRLAAAAMLKNAPEGDDGERGVIIDTASIAAYDGQVGQAGYSASKAGVAGMTLPLTRELSRYGIRIMTIAPGVFETPMMQGIPAEAVASLSALVPFPKRLGKGAEFAALAEHIVTNPMLNGDVIRLDGGIRMQ